MKKSDNSGLRYDNDKVRFDLIPPEATLFLARALTVGARKYAPRNWEKGMDWSRVLGSLKRHLSKWEMGKMYDDDSGEPNLALVLWNAMALLVYEQRGIGKDDRPELDYDFALIEDLHRLPKEESTPPPEVPEPPLERFLAFLNPDTQEEEAPAAVGDATGSAEEGVASSIAACAHSYRVPSPPNSEYSAAWVCTAPGCCNNK